MLHDMQPSSNRRALPGRALALPRAAQARCSSTLQAPGFILLEYTNAKDDARYRSEIAAVWPVLAAACVFAFCVGCALSQEEAGMGPMLRLAALVVAVLLVAGAVPCRYTLMSDALRLQSGFYLRRIPYAEIFAITLEQGWTWAPALSANRIVLHHTGGSVRISPLRQAEFLADLARRLPRTRGADLRPDLVTTTKTQR